MNLAGLKEAIIARVKSDTTSGGLWNSTTRLINSITYTFIGRGSTTGIQAAQPYVAFDLPAINESDGFKHDMVEFYLRFHIWVPFLRDKDTAITRASTINDRIFGNALAVNTRIPTYGFHRHLLVLSTTGDPLTPWQAGLMRRTSVNEAHEDDTLHFIQTYRVEQSRLVAA